MTTQRLLAQVTRRLNIEFDRRRARHQVSATVCGAWQDLVGNVAEPALPEMVERLARHRLAQAGSPGQ